MDYGADNMPISLKAKLLLRYDLFRYDLHKVPEIFWMWIAWKLPKPLVMWCAIRLMAHATTGQYGSQEVGTVSIMDALQRWDK
jgi:hypothetical protein